MRIPIPGFAVLAFILCNIPLAAQQGSVETLAGFIRGSSVTMRMARPQGWLMSQIFSIKYPRWTRRILNRRFH